MFFFYSPPLPLLEYELFDNDFFNFNFSPYPQALLEEFEKAQTNQRSYFIKGIIPELYAAYLAINNKLYIWNLFNMNGSQGKKSMYEKNIQNQKIYSFGPFSSVITAVGFGNPAKTVLLQSEVKNLLVVALINEIKLLQVIQTDKGFTIEEVETSIATDHIEIQTVIHSCELPKLISIRIPQYFLKGIFNLLLKSVLAIEKWG